MKLAYVLLALAAGAVLPAQAAMNAELRSHVGRPEWASILNFGVGLAALLVWARLSQAAAPTLGAMGRAPLWSWGGGILGAAYVTALILVAPRLGVAAALALTVAGQMAAALAIDHYGLMGMAVRSLSGARLLGGGLVALGVVLLRR